MSIVTYVELYSFTNKHNKFTANFLRCHFKGPSAEVYVPLGEAEASKLSLRLCEEDFKELGFVLFRDVVSSAADDVVHHSVKGPAACLILVHFSKGDPLVVPTSHETILNLQRQMIYGAQGVV